MTPTLAPEREWRSSISDTDDDKRARAKASRERQRLSKPFEMPDLSSPGELLSAEETAFFVENGFLIKPALLDPYRLEETMALIWDHAIEVLPRRPGTSWTLDRGDRSTWFDPQWDKMPPHPDSGPFQGRQPLEYYGPIVKMHDIGTDPRLLSLFPNDPGVRAIASALLGDDLQETRRTRGIYAVFPSRSSQSEADLRGSMLGPHADQVCQQLNACAYLDDVAPRNAGFTVYPGSHEIMFQQHELEANWSPRDTYRNTLARIAEEIEPLELCAPKGSVVFWHGRTVHSVGLHTGTDIRWALFADFARKGAVRSDDEHRKLLQYEWFKDTKLFVDDHTVTDDMWRHWRVGGG